MTRRQGAGAREVKGQEESLRRAARQAGMAISEFVAPASRHVLSHQIRLHYLDWGNPDKPPILFLHGVGMTAHSFDLVALAIRGDFHCMSLDQRGHGDSEWSLDIDYSTEAQGVDLLGLMNALNLPRVSIVGMSMGGLNAIRFAADNPDRVDALVLVDIGPDIQIVGSDRVKSFMDEPPAFETIDEVIERAIQFNPRRDPMILRHSLAHNLRKLPNGKWAWKWDPRPLMYADEAAEEASRRALWGAVEELVCPCLVVRGAQSDLFSQDDARFLAKRLRLGTWIEVANAGHNVQGDNPAGLVAAIRQFLKDTNSRGARH